MSLTEIINSFPPVLIFLIGALVMLFVPSRARAVIMLVCSLLVLAALPFLQDASLVQLGFLNFELVPFAVDRLSVAFAYVFCLISFFGGLYAFHLKDRGQQIAAMVYAGGSLGAIFAGDLFSLFIFWEIMLAGSAYLIWARKTPEAAGAGMRYIIVHLAGGSFLLAGIIWHLVETGSLDFGLLEGAPSYLILIGFLVNAAVPPLHAWLPDAYPQSTVTGSVFLSAFTTKVAVYALVRGFAGLELLVWAGAIMAVYGVIYAFLENDIRKILSHHIVSQVGFMVAAIGIGSALSVNGAVAHAFTNILNKGLLFMGTGAILYATGKSKLNELGGLLKQTPYVFVLYMIGAVSISGFPLFCGFVSKGMVTYSAETSHYIPAFIMLNLASVGTFLSVGLKLPYYTWFGKKSQTGITKPVPAGMYTGMALTALSCVIFGVFPGLLGNLLPYASSYQPYTLIHFWETLSIVLFSGLMFWVLIDSIKPKPGITLDFDWFYRRPAPLVYRIFVKFPSDVFSLAARLASSSVSKVAQIAANPVGFFFWHYKNTVSKIKGEPSPEMEPAVYNPHRYRNSLGIMVLMVMFGFVFVAVITWLV
jgi:multicomponent Na+:H+ antiporter subunit D